MLAPSDENPDNHTDNFISKALQYQQKWSYPKTIKGFMSIRARTTHCVLIFSDFHLRYPHAICIRFVYAKFYIYCLECALTAPHQSTALQNAYSKRNKVIFAITEQLINSSRKSSVSLFCIWTKTTSRIRIHIYILHIIWRERLCV